MGDDIRVQPDPIDRSARIGAAMIKNRIAELRANEAQEPLHAEYLEQSGPRVQVSAQLDPAIVRNAYPQTPRREPVDKTPGYGWNFGVSHVWRFAN